MVVSRAAAEVPLRHSATPPRGWGWRLQVREDAGVEELEVGDRGIRLGQLLKLVGWVDSGGAVKSLLAAGEVAVNGTPEHRRGAQLAVGDVVTLREAAVRLT